ncbi:MAG: GNAT family N-acetyltransferase [Proteobacteria bacterium]|nr:GNAT family N-acetyltransferase [Pseudomonadota bacterium]
MDVGETQTQRLQLHGKAPYRIGEDPMVAGQLEAVNAVIARAVKSWPTTSRLKRLAMAPLQYRSTDLQDFEFLLCYKAHACVGIAVWQPDTPLALQQTPSGEGVEEGEKTVNAVLLHGLFVSAQAQGCGIGGLLLDELTRRARQKQFAGIFVRAERFSTSYFEQKGFRQLNDGEELGLVPTNYPHRFLLDVGQCAEGGGSAAGRTSAVKISG